MGVGGNARATVGGIGAGEATRQQPVFEAARILQAEIEICVNTCSPALSLICCRSETSTAVHAALMTTPEPTPYNMELDEAARIMRKMVTRNHLLPLSHACSEGERSE